MIIASKGGAPANPSWYRNLPAHPIVTVETGTDTLQARADLKGEPERSRLYAKMVAQQIYLTITDCDTSITISDS